jgi:tetratricopeptide (TPR) repeat protein
VSSAAIGRFVVGLCVGVAVGFFAANAINRRGAAPAPSAPSPAAPSVTAPATPDPREDLSDEEVSKAKTNVDARPDDFTAQYNFAEFLLRIRQKPADAVPYYKRASELEPKNPGPHIGLGDASFASALASGKDDVYDAKLLDEAAASYERAIALDPKNPVSHATLGLTRTLRRPPDYARAIREFRTALATDPKNELALQGLATALAGTGDVAGAEAAADRLAAADPQSPGLGAAREAIAKAKAGHR